MNIVRLLCAVAGFAMAAAAAAQIRGFAETQRTPTRDTEREPREPPSWDRDRDGASSDTGSLSSPHSAPSPPTAWTPPVEETSGLPPLREPEFAAARCETYRRQMVEAHEAEARGENRAAQRQAIQQARARAGC